MRKRPIILLVSRIVSVLLIIASLPTFIFIVVGLIGAAGPQDLVIHILRACACAGLGLLLWVVTDMASEKSGATTEAESQDEDNN